MCAVMGKWKHAKQFAKGSRNPPQHGFCAQVCGWELFARPSCESRITLSRIAVWQWLLCALKKFKAFRCPQMISQIFLVLSSRRASRSLSEAKLVVAGRFQAALAIQTVLKTLSAFQPSKAHICFTDPGSLSFALGTLYLNLQESCGALQKQENNIYFITLQHILHVQKEHTHYVEEQRQRSWGVGRRSPYSSPLVL